MHLLGVGVGGREGGTEGGSDPICHLCTRSQATITIGLSDQVRIIIPIQTRSNLLGLPVVAKDSAVLSASIPMSLGQATEAYVRFSSGRA